MAVRIIDVFNGDADGLCALHQLRLAQPADGERVTGLKREIDLLARVDAGADARITVLDIALARNRAALERLLARGAHVRWFDHHWPGDVPVHRNLEAHIDPAPDTCTSLIVDRHLGGCCAPWAIVAAFGDNLIDVGERRAAALGLDAETGAQLRALGEALNYNSYGDTEADVLIHPRELYLRLRPYADPLDFARGDPIVAALIERRANDLARAAALEPVAANAQAAVYALPDQAWCRRVLGTFAHALANAHPRRAHAVLKDNGDGTSAVSVRAPQATRRGADALARRFGGGGRAAAAGIDRLRASQRESFAAAFLAERWD
jgi:hypothetical protein